MKICTSKLLNFSVEAMNSIVEDIIDLLQDKSNLSPPYRKVFVISLSCFCKMFSSIFLNVTSAKKRSPLKMRYLRHRLRIFLLRRKIMFRSPDIQVFVFLTIP